jgi:chemotaxis protein methyltransferase CheR
MSLTYVPFLRGILERRAGLDLGRGGMETTLANFVHQRLERSGLSFERYLEQLEIPGSEELRLLVEAMTVVYTWFFRDPAQFLVIEQLMREFPGDRPMSIWVAGCATGEEPYSVALVAAEIGRRVSILGTDVNSAALEHAKQGRYSAASLNAIDAPMRQRYLADVSGDFVIPEPVKQSVRFQLGNLIDVAPRCPTGEGWDLIICRNVLIYFTPEQARRTLDAFASGLAPGRHLVLGASEAILERPVGLDVIGIAGRAVLKRPLAGQCSDSSKPDSNGSLVSFSRINLPQPRPSALNAPAPPAVATREVAFEKPSGVVRTHRNDGADVVPITALYALEKGRTALDAGDVVTAKRLCSEAVQLDPTCAEAAMFAGITHYLDGEFPEALQLLRGALCLDETLWAACFYQALCFENIGYAEDAARSYAQVMTIAEKLAHGPTRHPFLENWRNDLLAVAKKRAHPAKHRNPSSHKLRIQAR